MASVFIDAAHLLAIVRPRDELHEGSLELGRRLLSDGARFVTTTLVLAELLAGVARHGVWLREQVSATVRDLQKEHYVTIVQLTPELFERSLQLYESRRDKAHSLTDCASMVVCRDLGIAEVLTADRDFVQEGFRALLLQDG